MRAEPTVRRVGNRAVGVSAVMVALLTVFLTGCTDEPAAPPAQAEATVAPLTDLDLGGLSAVRAPYCETLDPGQLSDVLGGDPHRTSSYKPGDRVGLAPGMVDVVQEYGCSYFRGPVTARTWLFAQPVTNRGARSLVAERAREQGCRPAGVLEFGAPGVVQTCRPAQDAGASGAAETVVLAGLFGDGYLTCEVTAPGDPSLLERTQRWCAGVAEAVATP